MGYILKFYDEITDLVNRGESVESACIIVKEKHNISRSANGMGIAYGRAVRKGVKPLKTKTKSTTKSNNYTPKKFVLSAWNKKGYMMDIDEYCAHYTLPRADITSYKLVSHTGTPFYNIVFKENIELEKTLTYEFIESAVLKNAKPVKQKTYKVIATNYFDRAVYTDVHVGMTPNKTGHSLYGGEWNKEVLFKRLDVFISEIIARKKGNVLIIDDLGDLFDGWNGQTVRKGHDLPQNMDNSQAFEVALAFKVKMVDALVDHYQELIINNICEDNHAGEFGYILNYAFKKLIEVKHSEKVKVTNHRKFINHYFYGSHCFVISHGKDSKNLKFGFKPQLDSKQIEKIDQYIKQNNIYKKNVFIEFSKGDSHQLLLDYCTSDDFDYFNYLAMSPASEWVQTNFKKGRSGFVLQHIKEGENVKEITPIFY